MFRVFEDLWLFEEGELSSLGKCAINENEIIKLQHGVSDEQTDATFMHMKNEDIYFVYESLTAVVERLNNRRL